MVAIGSFQHLPKQTLPSRIPIAYSLDDAP
jgi:hypothetical protein